MTEGTESGELWASACSGDEAAFGAIFDAYRDRVYRHACRLVIASHEAEDVTAAAFLELWRRRDSVRLVSGSVLPWLLVTTGNLARIHRRAAFRYRRFLAGLPRSAAAPDIADHVVGSHFLGLEPELGDALKALRGTDLHLLTLVAIEDYTIADAADVLDISSAAAKTRLHRIRTKLRSQSATIMTAASPPPEAPR